MSDETPVQAGKSPPVLTATELRRVAEFAHSLRGPEARYLVVRKTPRKEPDGTTIYDLEIKVEKDLPATSDGALVVPVCTEDWVPRRTRITRMLLTVTDAPEPLREPGDERAGETRPPDSNEEVDLFRAIQEHLHDETVHPDAIFWTESAVEKFLFPYYASVFSAASETRSAETEVEKIRNLFNGKRSRKGQEDASREEESTIFALVHLPKSEYVASPSGMVAALRWEGGKVTVEHVDDPAGPGA